MSSAYGPSNWKSLTKEQKELYEPLFQHDELRDTWTKSGKIKKTQSNSSYNDFVEQIKESYYEYLQELNNEPIQESIDESRMNVISNKDIGKLVDDVAFVSSVLPENTLELYGKSKGKTSCTILKKPTVGVLTRSATRAAKEAKEASEAKVPSMRMVTRSATRAAREAMKTKEPSMKSNEETPVNVPSISPMQSNNVTPKASMITKKTMKKSQSVSPVASASAKPIMKVKTGKSTMKAKTQDSTTKTKPAKSTMKAKSAKTPKTVKTAKSTMKAKTAKTAKFNKGTAYEETICGIIGSSCAGATHDVPDCWLHVKDSKGNITAEPVEIKLDIGADFGQMNLQWDKENNGFTFSGENEEMKNLYKTFVITSKDGNSYSLLEYINSPHIWGNHGIPAKYKLTKQSTLIEKIDAWSQDKEKFQNKFIEIPFDTITTFYSNKKFGPEKKSNNLIQIGHSNVADILEKTNSLQDTEKSKGLYYFKDVPSFDKNIPKFVSTRVNKDGVPICRLRIRLKTGKSGKLDKGVSPNWSFLLALVCDKIEASKNKSLDDLDNRPVDNWVLPF